MASENVMSNEEELQSANAKDPLTRFSIITASYNRAHLLPRCLDSILQQKFSQFEAIVVDDGSTDNTEQVVEEFVRRDNRIRYVRQDNSGANAARNLGARKARGQYILMFDSDDEVFPDWLEKLDKLVMSAESEVACCGIEFVDEREGLLDVLSPDSDTTGTSRGGLYLSGTYAVRRDVFLQLGGFAEGLPAHQHTEFRMRLFAMCESHDYCITSIPDILVRAHSHSGPKIRTNPAAKLEATKYILAHHSDKFEGPGAISSWLASAGGCAAQLGNYGKARQFFARAIRMYPVRWKNYARFVLAAVPAIRRLFWRQNGPR